MSVEVRIVNQGPEVSVIGARIEVSASTVGIQGPPGTGGTGGTVSFTVDATGTLANRANYDGEADGFAYLATDTGNLHFRESGAWSAPVPFEGPPGADGDSAYQVAVDQGFVGDETEWLGSLQGVDGAQGIAGVDGAQGVSGANGADGLSAYQVAVNEGFVGDETAWLTSLQGVDGASFSVDATGLLSERAAYDSEAAGFAFLATDTGDLYIREGVSGWSAPIPFQGPPGLDGSDGADGADGAQGVAGADGADGLSAYQLAVNAGFVGNEAAWLASLRGADGADGADGAQGVAGVDGADGLSAYQVAVNAGFVGDEAAWIASLQGADGPQGLSGNDGVDGAQGPAGADGTDGANVTITVAADQAAFDAATPGDSELVVRYSA